MTTAADERTGCGRRRRAHSVVPWAALLALLLAPAGATPGEEAAAGLARRVLGPAAAGLRFEQVAADGGRDVFALDSRDGRVLIQGNSALALAVGLNWYLKYYAHASVSLNGNQLALPTPLPPVSPPVRLTAWAPARYFLNYCTFSYATVWWDWPQWERFIDWMALNGINQPLAITGQEAVWQVVGQRFGLSAAELATFLAGPPYLPFSWMGCLDSFGGPLPADWIPRHLALGQQILARERPLGMTPVLQGFTGHVPSALLRKYPDAKAQRIRWIEFDTWMLEPTDPLFARLGSAWVAEQTRLFGSDHLYAADSFIEMTPPSGDLTYLANTSRAIYNSLRQADPEAVWLLQGWTFMSQARFWRPERIKAFLDAAPPERLVVLDLFCDSRPVWNQTQGFHGKPWIWSFVHLFGDNTTLGSAGPLARFGDLAAARAHPEARNLRGVGLMMEGFGHNPPLYDLMFELAWRDRVDLGDWLQQFARYRYGRANADAEAAWETLRGSVYGRPSNGTQGRTVVTAFPAVSPSYTRWPDAALARACRQLLRARVELGTLETYRHDVVNVARQALSTRAGRLHQRMLAAFTAKDAAAFRLAAAEFLGLLRDLDELLATNDQFLLGTWLAEAQRWGATEAERDRLAWNARRLLTVWGPAGSGGLRDYAWKEWAGLLSGFYTPRWELLVRRQQAALDAGQRFDEAACQAEVRRFEDDWCRAHDAYPTTPRGDSLDIAQRLCDRYLALAPANRSLTTDKPVTCSAALPGMDAGLANDGEIDTESYWGTDVTRDPAAWWQVDLERPTTVGRVVVVGYFGDQRSYGFTVEGSTDGRTWALLADRRSHREPSTAAGYTCQCAPTTVRYLKVTLTSNSANTGRHLVEVSAFEH